MKDDWRQDADLAHGLIKEAKGMAGDGIITDHLDAAENHIDQLEARIEALTAEVERKDAALVNCAASLAAAISLLENGGKAAKRAAASDKMFDQMILDYKASLNRARAALKGGQG